MPSTTDHPVDEKGRFVTKDDPIRVRIEKRADLNLIHGVISYVQSGSLTFTSLAPLLPSRTPSIGSSNPSMNEIQWSLTR